MKKSKRVVIVDDNIDITGVFADIFEVTGNKVVGIGHDGRDALELFLKHKPDFIFIDVMMPVMNGIEALKAIKENEPNAKVIMVTADNSTNTIMELEKLNATAIIFKPFKIEDIINVIEKFED
ncbi:response regulator [Nitrosarchaeum sp. AC2]|uniref:response regulator n=1 Tax=Nitrosarchaeum sp. AC2 TaxID=2259673 RepID=UPI0015C7D813|nr:response regulator [Nitrosarchaeum sp. AC2]QLH11082.1 response regulator [Nitrosarchaeum sp. AC2]